MRSSILFALALGSLVAGCDEGPAGSETADKFDAGPEAGVIVVLDAGGGPATPPDGASACPTGICNYQTGTGCSGATSACLPGVTGNAAAPMCSPPGSVPPGGACAQAADCTAGYLCAVGKCRKLCCGDDWSACDAPTDHCTMKLEYKLASGVVDTGAMLCFPADECDPLVPTSCAAPGTACMIADATGATVCLPPGTGGSGEACPCQGGFACASDAAGVSPTCHRLCGAVPGGAPPYCQEGEGVCVHHDRDPAGVGECLHI
jgi:hypothetical protein